MKVTDLNGRADPDHQYATVTDPEQALEAKPPYDDVKMMGMVEGRFLFTTALSPHVLPFIHSLPLTSYSPSRSKMGHQLSSKPRR